MTGQTSAARARGGCGPGMVTLPAGSMGAARGTPDAARLCPSGMTGAVTVVARPVIERSVDGLWARRIGAGAGGHDERRHPRPRTASSPDSAGASRLGRVPCRCHPSLLPGRLAGRDRGHGKPTTQAGTLRRRYGLVGRQWVTERAGPPAGGSARSAAATGREAQLLLSRGRFGMIQESNASCDRVCIRTVLGPSMSTTNPSPLKSVLFRPPTRRTL